MIKLIMRSLGHFLLVSLVIITIGAVVGFTQHASISLGDAPLAYKVGNEGPYAFYEEGELTVSYIRGTRDNGFSIDKQRFPAYQSVPATAYFSLDDSTFNFTISPLKGEEQAVYDSPSPIIAISDLEGNYKALRDFLIANNVITPELEWSFGDGHLVLLGDMVDRGFSTTQLLWFIYKLEQDALKSGGKVHVIVGNHEIKNMQGNVKSAANKYIPIAGFLEKSTADLLGENAFLGRWLATKNTIERINGHLFVHGGIHADIIKHDFSIDEINTINRRYYQRMYYPGLADERTSVVISTTTGPAWYRGYFKGEVDDVLFDQTLTHFSAKSITVGHTLQFSVNSHYDNKLFAIDVKHPNDYRESIPIKHSEGLMIQQDTFFRLLDDGKKIALTES